MSENGKVLAALLGGVAAGVAIGMFISSEKGSAFKKTFGDATTDLTDKIMQKAEDLMGMGKKSAGDQATGQTRNT
jgi:hypothetical protein